MPCSNGYGLLEDSEILPEEKFEKILVGALNPKVYLAPWRSLWAAGKLHEIKIPSTCEYTILKWEWEIPEISKIILESGVNGVFCTSTGKKCPLKTYLYPDFVRPEITSSNSKSGVFFMGWVNNILRRSIFAQYKDKFSVTLRDSYYSYDQSRNKEFDREYVSGLASASVCLCPRGVGSGTRRFWESLRAEAVPMLISDELALPSCWSWEETIIRVSERRAIYSPNALWHAAQCKDIESKRQMCKLASQYFINPDNIARYINDVVK